MKRDFSKLDRLLEEFASHSVPGCTCTIMQGDKVIILTEDQRYNDLSDIIK